MTFSAGVFCKRAAGAALGCLLALLCPPVVFAASGGRAADAGAPIDRSAWESGWHVVRPGDTLEGLAARFLGSSELWRELHMLNPLVQDPDVLFPGQRLRIFLERPTAQPSAQVMAIARDVRELPSPVPWRPASEGDVLLERDALRTAQSASARLRFDDDATVTLSEDSLVFIRRSAPATSPVPRKEIEIELGQADIETAPAKPGAAGHQGEAGSDAIEVVVAGARSLASAAGGRMLSTRSRRATGDTAQFMVFTGKSTVSAAGASIEVPAGSGTSVPPKAKPGPVEPLLRAPSGLRPEDEEELAKSNPELSWNTVPGAAHYTVEVCRDAVCGALVDRIQNVIQSPLLLPTDRESLAGTLYWRVTAVAPSGLDGFPSATSRFSAVDALTSRAPVLALESAAGEVLAAESCLAARPEVVVHAAERSRPERPWRLLLDGRETGREEFRALALAGRHEVAARVTDARGRTSDSPTIAFTVDAAAPWVDLVAAAAGAEPTADQDPAQGRRSRRQRPTKEPAAVPACDSGLEVLGGKGIWSAVPCSTGSPAAPAILALDPSHSTVSLRTTGGGLVLGGMPVAAGETLSLRAWDVGCGGGQVALRIVPSPYRTGRMLLEVEVADLAGNRRAQGWHLARR